MRVLSVVGTRPEIIKNLAFWQAAKELPGVELTIVHTNQNFGYEMADRFIEELGLTVARQNGGVDRTTLGSAFHGMYDFIVDCMGLFKPDVLISLADTDTAFLTALAGARNSVPVAHIEGGIITEARNNAEETNRRMCDQLATWHFPAMREHYDCLLARGFSERDTFLCGDITLDSLLLSMHSLGIRPLRGDYNVLTIHRQENANSPARLATIFDAVEQAGVPTVFPVHPRTRSVLEASGLGERLERSTVITARPPASHGEIVGLLAGCNKVLTDSGGLRRETYMLGKPLITLVPFVWFKEIKQLGFKYTADAVRENILWAIREFDPPGERPPIFGDGHAGRHILAKLQELLG